MCCLFVEQVEFNYFDGGNRSRLVLKKHALSFYQKDTGTGWHNALASCKIIWKKVDRQNFVTFQVTELDKGMCKHYGAKKKSSFSFRNVQVNFSFSLRAPPPHTPFHPSPSISWHTLSLSYLPFLSPTLNFFFSPIPSHPQFLFLSNPLPHPPLSLPSLSLSLSLSLSPSPSLPLCLFSINRNRNPFCRPIAFSLSHRPWNRAPETNLPGQQHRRPHRPVQVDSEKRHNNYRKAAETNDIRHEYNEHCWCGWAGPRLRGNIHVHRYRQCWSWSWEESVYSCPRWRTAIVVIVWVFSQWWPHPASPPFVGSWLS